MPRKFSQEYKAEAVKLVTKGGLSNQQAAEDLEIGVSTMEKWVRERSQPKEAEVGIPPNSCQELTVLIIW